MKCGWTLRWRRASALTYVTWWRDTYASFHYHQCRVQHRAVSFGTRRFRRPKLVVRCVLDARIRELAISAASRTVANPRRSNERYLPKNTIPRAGREPPRWRILQTKVLGIPLRSIRCATFAISFSV